MKILLNIILVIVLLGSTFLFSAENKKDSHYSIASVMLVSGTVEKKEAESKDWQKVTRSSTFYKGGKIKISENSRIVITLSDGRNISLKEKGTYDIDDIIKKQESKKKKGVFSKFKKQKDQKKVTAVAGVRGKKKESVEDIDTIGTNSIKSNSE